MSSQNELSLEEAIDQMMQRIELEIISTSYAEIVKMSQGAAETVSEEYDTFFRTMYSLLGSEEVPDLISPYVEGAYWHDLTARWAETKDRIVGMSNSSDFYKGITAGYEDKAFLGRSSKKNSIYGTYRTNHKTRRPKGVAKVQPFAKYISSLQTAGTTERFFGPVSISYDFQAPDANIRFAVTMKGKTSEDTLSNNEIKKITARNVKKGQWATKPEELRIMVNIEAFNVLQQVARTERAIVDLLLKRIDPQHENQWVKINGSKGWFGKGHRPIRPLVEPLIQYFINEELPATMRAAYRRL